MSARPSDGFDIQFTPTPSAVSNARAALADVGLPQPLLHDAQLVISELLTNSIRYAGLEPRDQIRVLAQWSGTRLRVDVWDRVGGTVPLDPPEGPAPALDGESGRGLYLVNSMATRWGTAHGHSWFELNHNPNPG